MSPRDLDHEAALPKFSLNRRITVLMLAVTIALVGGIAANKIPAEMLPTGFVLPFMNVQVPWDDAPGREVLEKVTIPLEEELSTVRGIQTVVSISFTGGSRVFMRFKQGTDMSIAYREVRDRIERAKVNFPSDIDQTFINKADLSGLPVYAIGIAVDPGLANSYDLIQNAVVARLERLDGVASVEAFGLEEKEILIELDREKTNSAGLNIYELAEDLGDDNFTMASGTVRNGSQKLLMRSMANYRSLEELENRRIAPSIRLADIASIRYEEPDKTYRTRVMSRPAVALQIIKEAEANTQELCERLDEEYASLEQDPRLAGLWMKNYFSQGEIIDESLGTLVKSGMIGGLLAAMVLFAFMRRVRLTMIVALSIPLSLVVGLTVMYFAGESLNILTLIGLMICVGLLVDNSVVVAENIHRLHREGMPRRDACIKGAGEVGLAITMSTLTTIIVFLPALLAEGPAQFFMMRLAIPVAVSVAGSLVIALLFIPISVYLTLPTGLETRAPGRLKRAHERVNDLLRIGYEATFGRVNRGYCKVLEFFLSRRLEMSLAVVAILAISVGIFSNTTKFVGSQEDEQAQFELQFDLPSNTTLEESEEYFLAVEKTIEAYKDEYEIDGWFIFHRKTFGEVQAWFAPERTAPYSAKETMQVVMDGIPERAGVEIFAGDEANSEENALSTHVVFVRGEDPDLVNDVADQVADVLVNVDGVVGRLKAGGDAPSELGLIIDRERAQHVGVNPQVIAGLVGYTLRGTSLPRFQAEGREVPVRVRFQESDRESLTELASFQVPTNDGGFLPLSALTESRVLPETRTIFRRNKMVGYTVTLELEEGREEEVRETLVAMQAAMDLPEGVSFGGDSRQAQSDDDLSGLISAALLSVIFIYLLMAFLFESFILPLSIVLTIPLSGIGMMWGHIISGVDIDFLGAVAVIILVGVVVNNGIVLIDYVNRLRLEGRNRREALLRATDLRFRPIMMTAITTVGGMVPLALAGASSIGLSYTSFSLTLIGGLITATLLTLLVVPVFYTLFDDAREFGSRMFGNLLRGRSARATSPDDAPAMAHQALES
ncbi:MAG: efflux RND transporter permease subunit [Acidobacteriota bacterium]|nr:efflux RND transporter permease subunit [Acidobacteriota bacterium]MDH3783786.1 efflux RND transporter permease subunit [Acidobacteriota bacterium]